MSDERCDLCGKLLQPPEGTQQWSKVCKSNIGVDGEVYPCIAGAFGDTLAPGYAANIVREAQRAPLLRAALREALDGWERTLDAYCESRLTREPKEQRIHTLRAKYLG